MLAYLISCQGELWSLSRQACSVRERPGEDFVPTHLLRAVKVPQRLSEFPPLAVRWSRTEAGGDGSASPGADFAADEGKQRPPAPGSLCQPRGCSQLPQIRDMERSCSLLLSSLPSHQGQQWSAWLQKGFHPSEPQHRSWHFSMCLCLIFAKGSVDTSRTILQPLPGCDRFCEAWFYACVHLTVRVGLAHRDSVAGTVILCMPEYYTCDGSFRLWAYTP